MIPHLKLLVAVAKHNFKVRENFNLKTLRLKG